MEKLTLLHVTDFHFNTAYFNWVIKQLDTFDVLCLSGDLIESTKEKGQVEWVSHWLENISKPTFICSGNHDTEKINISNEELLSLNSSIDDYSPDEWNDVTNFHSERERVNSFWMNNISNPLVHADNSITKINNIIIGCAPCDNPILRNFKNCDILLHHLPPDNTPTSIQKGKDWGCNELSIALKYDTITPKYILCGHVHEPDATEYTVKNTLIINPGAVFNAEEPPHHYLSL